MKKTPELYWVNLIKTNFNLESPLSGLQSIPVNKDGMGFQISSDKEGNKSLFHVLNMDNDNTANFISGLFDITTKTNVSPL